MEIKESEIKKAGVIAERLITFIAEESANGLGDVRCGTMLVAVYKAVASVTRSTEELCSSCEGSAFAAGHLLLKDAMELFGVNEDRLKEMYEKLANGNDDEVLQIKLF